MKSISSMTDRELLESILGALRRQDEYRYLSMPGNELSASSSPSGNEDGEAANCLTPPFFERS